MPCRASARSTDGRLPASYSTSEIFMAHAHSSPLVLGSTRFSCGSRVAANRNARANALKIASTWWCVERP